MTVRRSHRTLTGSRIYQRRNRFYLFAREPLENPKTGKVSKWHSLCPVSAGELRAREEAERIVRHNSVAGSGGNMPVYLDAYKREELLAREKRRPKEKAREAIFEDGLREVSRLCRVISEGFADFDVEEVLPVDVATFVDQWRGQRSAQVYLSRLADFFRWARRRGLRADNPAEGIGVEKPPKRRRYLSDAEWHSIRDALLVGLDGRATPSGPMIQCYADLCFLLYQRTTEVRLLKWSQVDLERGSIAFTPTKTERSSGLSVEVPITPAIRSVLDRARAIGVVKSVYVVHTLRGKPYTSRGIGDAWERARKRAGVEDAILKDIRSKAATDAKRAGFSRSELRIALAHTSEGMTETYLRGRDADVSKVVLELPARPKAGGG